jgi:hypothetical protein
LCSLGERTFDGDSKARRLMVCDVWDLDL